MEFAVFRYLTAKVVPKFEVSLGIFLVIHLISGGYLLQGQYWARRLYLWATPLIILFVALRSAGGPAPGTGLAVGVLGATYAAAAAVLFQPSSKAFFARSRPQ